MFLIDYLFVFGLQGLEKRTVVTLSQLLPAPHNRKSSKTTRMQSCKQNSGNASCSGKASELRRKVKQRNQLFAKLQEYRAR